jgi:ligand-binding sensor domain-containing protein
MYSPLVAKEDIHQKKHQKALLKQLNYFTYKTRNNECNMLLSLIVLFSLLFCTVARAQDSFHYLPETNTLVQDKNGFIWLATLNGLIRHTGEENITFNNNNKDWPLPFNWVNDVYMVDDRHLLLATETHSLWLFDTITGEAEELAIDIHRKSIYQVIEFLGDYYLDAPDKLYKVSAATLATTTVANNIDIKQLKKTDKYLYISNSEGLFRLQGNELQLILLGNITAIETIADTIIVAKNDELITISDTEIKQTIPISKPIYALTKEYQQDNFFSVNTNGEISKYSLEKLAELTHTYADISPVYVKEIIHDSSGVLWVLSNQGVQQQIPSLTKNHPKFYDVSINSIALAPHNNQLFIGSYGAGLDSFFSDNSELWQTINSGFSSRAKIITDLVSVDDVIYISTFDGLWIFSLINKTVNRVDFSNNKMLLIDLTYKNGLLYVTTNENGVLVYDPNIKKIVEHIKGEQLSSSETINVLPLDNNSLWIATAAGINIFDEVTKNIIKINNLGENKVISLLESHNKIFVATKGDGLFVYNKLGELLSHFAKNLSFGYMSLINDHIWVSGQPGLYRINPDNYQVKMLPNTEQYTFTQKPVALNGIVYAGHFGGVVEIPLKQQATFHSKILISKTIASGKAELLSRNIELASPNDVITLELASLDFRPGQDKRFKYQINKGDWYEINGNQLTLTGLSPGDYRIEIMGTNSLRQWSNFKTYADISVAYPWYWRMEMRVIYSVLLVSIISITLWLLYLRSKSISHIHSLLSSEIKLRGKSALNVRRNLTSAIELLTAQTQLSIAEKNQVKKITGLLSESIDELSKHSSSNEPSSLSGSSLPAAIPYLMDYFHHKYQVLIEVTIEINDTKMDYSLQAAIYKIIYEALSSAIINGNSGKFLLSVKEINEKIWLDIIDNEHSFTHFSSKINFNMAMYYIRQVANQYNATFHTFDNKEEGSQLVISIPLVRKN